MPLTHVYLDRQGDLPHEHQTIYNPLAIMMPKSLPHLCTGIFCLFYNSLCPIFNFFLFYNFNLSSDFFLLSFCHSFFLVYQNRNTWYIVDGSINNIQSVPILIRDSILWKNGIVGFHVYSVHHLHIKLISRKVHIYI